MKYKSILFAKQKQRHRSREQTYGYQGSKGKSAELGDWNWHIYTIDTMYKILELTIELRELHSALWWPKW